MELEVTLDTQQSLVESFSTLVYKNTPLAHFKKQFAIACRDCSTDSEIKPTLLKDIQRSFRAVINYLNTKIYRSNLDTEQQKALGEWAHQEFIAFVLLGTWPSRSFRKPQDIAGDHHTIKQIYANGNQERRAIGHVVNHCFFEEPACKAVVNRKNYIIEEVRQLLNANQGQDLHVTSVACGPAEELFSVYEQLADADKKQLKATGLDLDLRACSYVEDKAKQQRLRGHFRVHHADILKPHTYPSFLEPQDLVYSMGLTDYFSDRLCVKTLNNIYDILKPGGEVIVGNFHARCPSRVFLDYMLDWPLIYRTEEDMERIFAASKFGESQVYVDYEEERVNMLVRCKKR